MRFPWRLLLSPLDIVDLDRAAADEAAVIRAQLEKKGTPIGPYDMLIAGLARSVWQHIDGMMFSVGKWGLIKLSV